MRKVTLLLLSALIVSACAHDISPRPTSPTDIAAHSLINELASRFPPAHDDLYLGGASELFVQHPVTPRDKDALRVESARTKLLQMGIIAFPELIRNVHDPRFSHSITAAAWLNVTVGETCFGIVQSQVDFYGTGYKARDAAGGSSLTKPSYLESMRSSAGLDQWWATHAGQTLVQLQIESLEWTIQQEQAAGFTDEKQRDTILVPLQKRLIELRQSGNSTGN